MFKRFVLACLSIILIFSLLPTASATGRIGGETLAGSNTELASASSANLTSDGLPVSVDNSAAKYFPPIAYASQGEEAYAAAYYLMSYTVARERGWDLRSGDESKIFSPVWIWNLTAHGNLEETADLLSSYGALTLQDYPLSTRNEWPTTADKWREALKYRVKSDLVNDLDTQALKESLKSGK